VRGALMRLRTAFVRGVAIGVVSVVAGGQRRERARLIMGAGLKTRLWTWGVLMFTVARLTFKFFGNTSSCQIDAQGRTAPIPA